MKVNLLDLPALYISLDSEEQLAVHLEKNLSDLGFKDYKRFVGIHDENSRIGCALSHLAALGVYEPPFIIFEADARPETFVSEVEVPDDADCLFLGYNHYTPENLGSPKPGTKKRGPECYSKVEGYEDLYKAKGLMATHAMVYFTKEHIEDIKNTIKYALTTGLAHDMFTCQIQAAANVYAVGTPMFHQVGRYHYMTHRRIDAF